MTDRLPPYDQRAEMAIIGACLEDPQIRIPEAAMVITAPEFFYDIRNRTAWEIISSMEIHAVNFITVVGRLKIPEAVKFLNECQDACTSAANLPAWLQDASDKWTLRKIIQTCQKSVVQAFESGDAISTLDAVEREILSIRPKQTKATGIKALLSEAIEIIERKATSWDTITGLSTGLFDLDKITDGLHPSELIVLAAYPSCGKTALMVNMAMHNALAGIPVGILSAEMRPVQLVIRSLCAEARVNFKRMDESSVALMIPQVGRFSSAPIYIQQATGWTIGQAQAQARRWASEYGIKFLGADYIQKFTGKGDNQEQEIASVGDGFKNIAMELSIPVVALSQLNDDGKIRGSRAPTQDGDSVWILANDGPWQSDVQPVNLRIEKCRDGETGQVPLTFLKTITRFECRAKESYTEQEGGRDD